MDSTIIIYDLYTHGYRRQSQNEIGFVAAFYIRNRENLLQTSIRKSIISIVDSFVNSNLISGVVL